MIVSQFVIANSPYQGVSQHYRLLLTNLAPKAYSFRITLRSHHWGLDQKVAYSVERPSSFMMDLVEPAGPHRYRGRYLFSVLPRETARIQLRPFDVSAWQAMQESMDVRGYLELTIPETVSGWAGPVQPQGTDPVPVLLHPFEVDWALATGYRDPAPVTLSSGMAENEIIPDKPSKFDVAKDFASLAVTMKDAESREAAAAGEPREDTAAFLEAPGSVIPVIAYLGRAAEKPENVEALNALLGEAGHTVRLVADRDSGRPRRGKR